MKNKLKNKSTTGRMLKCCAALVWRTTLAIGFLGVAAQVQAAKLPTPKLTVSGVTSSSVPLSWTDPYSGELNWSVERAPSGSSTFVVLSTLPANSLKYIDAKVSAGTGYKYRVGYLSGSGSRKYSSTLSVTTPAGSDTTPPVVALTAPASGAVLKGAVTLNASASDNIGVSRVEFYLDGASLLGTDTAAAYSVSLNTAGFTEGSHSLTAKAFDAAGNAAVSAAVGVSFDNTAPTVPSGVTATAPAYNQVLASWSASADPSGIGSYRLYRNGALLASVAGTSYSDTTVAEASTYCYTVSAVDGLGNVSALSSNSCVSTPAAPDTTDPSVPTGVSATAATCGQVNIAWTVATDAQSGVKSYKVFRNGVLSKTVLAPAISTSDTGLSASTAYAYAVSAVDNAGNESALSGAVTASTPACADTTPPTVPTGVIATASGCNATVISWAASSDATGTGVKGYNLYRNGGYLKQVLAPATSTSDAGLSASTAYSYAVSAVDNATNTSALSSSASVTTPACADTTPPTVPTGVIATASGCNATVISWAASSDAAGTGVKGYNLYRNGGYMKQVLAPATSASDTGLSASTAYSYAVCAVDNVTNISAPSPNVLVTTPTCPNLAPVASAGGNQSTAVGTSVTFNGSGSYDADGSIVSHAWSFGDGATASGATVAHAYAVAGTFVASLTVTDNQGATGTSTATVTVTAPPTATNRMVWGLLDGGTAVDFANAVAMAGSDIIVAGSFGGFMFLSRYLGDGTEVWTKVYGYGAASGKSVAVDGNSNIIVAGYFAASVDFGGITLTSVGGYDLFMAKYALDGRLIWVKQFGSASANGMPGDDSINDMAVDGNGDVCVAGNFQDTVDFGGGLLSSAGPKDGFIAKLRGADGSHLWSKRFGGTSSSDAGNGVCFDGAENVIMTGKFSGTNDFGTGPLVSSGADAVVVKYSASGAALWARRFGGTLVDVGRGVAADADGNIVVVGSFMGTAAFGAVSLTAVAGAIPMDDGFIAKLSVNGDVLWATRFGSTGYDFCNRVVVDGGGAIFLTGSCVGTVAFGGTTLVGKGGYEMLTARMTPDGVFQWAERLGDMYLDQGLGVALSPDGTVVAVGGLSGTITSGALSATAAGASDACVIKFQR